MSRNYTYEAKRELIATLNDKRGTTAVVNRSYNVPTRALLRRVPPSQAYSGLGVCLLKPHPTHGLDLSKNITEVYATDGYIKTTYTYSPYGLVTSTGNEVQSPPEGSEGDWTNPEGLPPAGASRQWSGGGSTSPMEQRIRRHRPRLLQLPTLQPARLQVAWDGLCWNCRRIEHIQFCSEHMLTKG